MLGIGLSSRLNGGVTGAPHPSKSSRRSRNVLCAWRASRARGRQIDEFPPTARRLGCRRDGCGPDVAAQFESDYPDRDIAHRTRPVVDRRPQLVREPLQSRDPSTFTRAGHATDQGRGVGGIGLSILHVFTGNKSSGALCELTRAEHGSGEHSANLCCMHPPTASGMPRRTPPLRSQLLDPWSYERRL